MFLGHRWRQLSSWAERQPLWFQTLVIPTVSPAVLGVAGICLCPRTAAASGTLLAVVYVWTLWNGLIEWPTIGREVGILYLVMVAHTYAGMAEYLPKELYSRWRGSRDRAPDDGGPGKSAPEA